MHVKRNTRMDLIIDASIAIAWFVDQPLSPQALRLAELHTPLLALDVLPVEMASSAWRLAQERTITADYAAHIVSNITVNEISVCASAPYIVPATHLALSLQHPVSECLYLACARDIGGQMVTTNARLLAAVKGTEADPFVCHLRDIVP